MSTMYKPSRAYIIRPEATRAIRIIEYTNPEQILPAMLREFFLEIGYSSMYPNFKNIRIDAVHPFAVLLYQEVLGNKLDLSVFPSITVSDSSDSEQYDTLSRGFDTYQLTAEDLARILGAVEDGKLLLSDTNKARLVAATTGAATVNAVKVNYRAQHNVDLNIWSENKDLTSLIYDMVKQFIMCNIPALQSRGLDILSPINGRRSGDINVEYGQLLFGANITVPCVIDTATMTIDPPMGEIATIGTTPTYHTTGEE